MWQSHPLDANRYSTSQEIPSILWNMKFPYRIEKRPPSDRILSQSKPLPASPFDFLKISFNIIITSTPRYSKWSLSISPCVILGIQSGTGTGFVPNCLVSTIPPFYHPRLHLHVALTRRKKRGETWEGLQQAASFRKPESIG